MLIYIKLTDLSYRVSEKSYIKWNTKSLCREGRRERERVHTHARIYIPKQVKVSLGMYPTTPYTHLCGVYTCVVLKYYGTMVLCQCSHVHMCDSHR